MAQHRSESIASHIINNMKRLPLILCEDVSGSMTSKCNLMNEQLQVFFSMNEKEPELCARVVLHIIQFSDTVSEKPATTLSKYSFTPFTPEQMGGNTHFWSALNRAIDIGRNYIDNPRFFAPWLLVYTDGLPNGDPEGLQTEVIMRLQRLEAKNDIIPFFLGIGDADDQANSLNLDLLSSISRRGKEAVAYALREKMNIELFFDFMMHTIITTMSGRDYFLKEEGSERQRLDIDLLYHNFSESIAINQEY